MKTYEVTITAYTTVVVVDAEDEQKAMEYASDGVSFGDFTMDETDAKELKTEQAIASSKHHADRVLEP